MSSRFPSNQTFNLVLAMCLAALATAVSMELRSQPIEVSKLMSDVQEILTTGRNEPVKKEASTLVETAAAAREIKPAEEATPAQPASKEPASTEAATNSVPAESRRAPATELAQPLALAQASAPYESGTPDASAAPINVSALSAKMQSAMPMEQAVRAPVAATVDEGAPEPPARPSVPPETKLASLPAKPGVILEDIGHKACIGGVLCEAQCKSEPGGCEVKPVYTIKLDRPTYISAVQFFAHDQVGPSRRSELFVKVNGESIGKIEAHRYGSTRTVKIGRVGQLVTIESRHKHNGFLLGGEEAVIWDVYLLGREAH